MMMLLTREGGSGFIHCSSHRFASIGPNRAEFSRSVVAVCIRSPSFCAPRSAACQGLSRARGHALQHYHYVNRLGPRFRVKPSTLQLGGNRIIVVVLQHPVPNETK
jgi:hypothetical protein